MSQIVYTSKVNTTYKTVRQGEPLFTDGLALPNEVGQLDSANFLNGGGTFLDATDNTRFTTPITLSNCRKRQVTGIATNPAIATGELTLSMENGDYFSVARGEDITRIDINNTVAGREHAFVLDFTKDASATTWTVDWDNVYVDGILIDIRWTGGVEPALTQDANGRDLIYILLIGGINATGYYILDVGEDPNALRELVNIEGTAEAGLSLLECVEKYPQSAVNTFKPAGASLKTVETSTERAAQVPIRVEGDAVVGALQMFGSTPELITATGITLQSGVVSACKFDDLLEDTSYETNTSIPAGATIAVDVSLGRMFDFPLQEALVTFAFTNVPIATGGDQPYTQVDILLLRDNSASEREVDWANTTVNGVIVPVLWEGKVTQLLGQNADELMSIGFFVFENFVVPRVATGIAPGTTTPLRKKKKRKTEVRL